MAELSASKSAMIQFPNLQSSNGGVYEYARRSVDINEHDQRLLAIEKQKESRQSLPSSMSVPSSYRDR